jgi:hypothetical protein
LGLFRPPHSFPVPSLNTKEDPTTIITSLDFDEIENFGDLELISETGPWQDFERLAEFIFEKHGFDVRVNAVKTGSGQKRQYDVIAQRCGRTYLVECKKWGGSRYRLSALKHAILQHRERTNFYEQIAHIRAIPMIVTLIEEEVRIFEGVPIVPVIRLNAFIRELDNYPDGDFSSLCEDELVGEEDLAEERDES